MMENNINIEEIEQYLEGSLEPNALAEFEKRLATDTVLARRVQLMKELDEATEDQNLLDLQKVTTSLGVKYFSQKSAEKEKNNLRKIPFYRRPLALAATVLFLIAMGWLLWTTFNNSGLSNQELFADFYTPYEAKLATRGSEEDSDLYDSAVRYYQAKNYDAAITSFTGFLDSIPNNNEARFTLAHALINNNPENLEQAKFHLERIIAEGKSILTIKAKWTLALIYLKEENQSAVKRLLIELSSSVDAGISNKAQTLLRQLN